MPRKPEHERPCLVVLCCVTHYLQAFIIQSSAMLWEGLISPFSLFIYMNSFIKLYI